MIGLALAGAQGRTVGAIIGVAFVALVGFFVGAVIELLRPVEPDAHLGGMRIMVGPVKSPPPDSDKDVWQLTLLPSGMLEVVDHHGADLITYSSSHHDHPVTGGHRYETDVQLQIVRGHR